MQRQSAQGDLQCYVEQELHRGLGGEHVAKVQLQKRKMSICFGCLCNKAVPAGAGNSHYTHQSR